MDPEEIQDDYFVILGLDGEPLYVKNISSGSGRGHRKRKAGEPVSYSFYDTVKACGLDDAVEKAHARVMRDLKVFK
jgi:hypothetical protein